MKLNLFSFLLLVSIVAVLSSCQKEPSSELPAPTAPHLVEYIEGEDFIKFNKAADGSVNKLTVKTEIITGGTVTDYQVNYDANNKIASLTNDRNEKIEVHYMDGQISRADLFRNGERFGYTAYNYVNNRLYTATIYYGKGVDFLPAMSYAFEWNAEGNVKNVTYLTENGVPNTLVRSAYVTMSYDRKVNPLYQYKDLLSLFWTAASKNNLLQENQFDADLKPSDRFSYVYKYNAGGLPQSATLTSGLPGETPLTSMVTYIYK